MKTSASGRALIEQREGRRLTAYRDTRGIWTIGVGHTGRMSPPKVVPAQTITEAECDALLATDLSPVEAVINTAVTVPLSQNEFDALASLGFNIGSSGLRGSTVIKKLNLGDIDGAAAAFMIWDHPAVLEGRRAAERAQFLTLDPVGAHSVTEARAEVLKGNADAKRQTARTTAVGGSATVVAGAAAVSTLAVTNHHNVGLIVAGIAILGAAIDGVAVWIRHQQAATLATNATKQAALVSKPPISATPIPAAPV